MKKLYKINITKVLTKKYTTAFNLPTYVGVDKIFMDLIKENNIDILKVMLVNMTSPMSEVNPCEEVIRELFSLEEYINFLPRYDAQVNLIINETEENIFYMKLKFDLDIVEYKENEWEL